MAHHAEEPSDVPWRRRLYVIIFEHETRAGRLFDVALLVAIAASVIVVLLESMPEVRARHARLLYAFEWAFTILFTIEYVARLLSVHNQKAYVLSRFGLVDLLSIIPTYLSLLVDGTQSLTVVRALRLLRVFRILKLPGYTTEAGHLTRALHASRRKITVFVFTVLTIVLIVGALMYLIEGPEHGFDSIPRSVYWAVVTLTTVGYGDIAPETALGRFVASAVMILGYGIIAVPTGIVTAELVSADRAARSGRRCAGCGLDGHDPDARCCKHCGQTLVPPPVGLEPAARGTRV
jgi:voltage-gated potassium channel